MNCQFCLLSYSFFLVAKVSEGSALAEVLSTNAECYDFCLCNPPFFENADEIRKKHQNSNETIADNAQKEEIFVKGGEYEFVKNILKDSLIYKDRIRFVLLRLKVILIISLIGIVFF